MRVCYESKNFSNKALADIETSNQIIGDYEAQGLSITLRQLYYQFVARGLIPNNDREYKKLGQLISNARMAGLVDWESIEDRTRRLRRRTTWNSPADIVNACAEQYHRNPWLKMENYVEVWVEKDALVGVLEAACDPLFVPYFSCRGYSSQTEMWNAAQRIGANIAAGKLAHVIHLGDHDPSGVDMTRDISDRIKGFLREDVGSLKAEHFSVKRIALTYDQVQQYNPPPNPAKTTDSRCADYVARYGDSSWELDALEPRMLVDLITIEVDKYIDKAVWGAEKLVERSQRARLAKIAKELSEGK